MEWENKMEWEIQKDDNLNVVRHVCVTHGIYICFYEGDEDISIDGDLTSDELREMADYIDNVNKRRR